MNLRFIDSFLLILLVGFASNIAVSCNGIGDAQDSGIDGDGGIIGDRRIGECTSHSECTIHSDCCNCLALAPGEDPPPCGVATCETETCETMGIEPAGEAKCLYGQCTVGFVCAPSLVTCRAPTPECELGDLPSVFDACWGPCVHASECLYVEECSDCDPAFYICVEFFAGFFNLPRCVVPPQECENDKTCECLEERVCFYPSEHCIDGQDKEYTISCRCIDCSWL